MKKAIAVVTLVAAFAFMAMPASALTVGKTSDESSVSWIQRLTVTLFERFTHTADITNDPVDSRASSGGNVVSGGDDSGRITVKTGGTESANLVENGANTTEIEGNLETPDATDADVTETSDESSVTLDSADSLDDNEDIVNDATVTNDQDSTADSGANVVTASDELYDTTVDTGKSVSATGTSSLFNAISKLWNRTVRIRP